MQKLHLVVLSITFTLFAVVLFRWGGVAGGFDQKKSQKKSKIVVLCTTSLLADAIKQVGGDMVEVRALMGPGVDPHLYRARESDIQALIGADIIFYNGLHLEGKMGELLEKMRSWKPVVAVGDSIAKSELLIAEFDDLYDPHIWQDVSLWLVVVRCIATELSAQYPQHHRYFEGQAAQYEARLNILDQWIHEQLAPLSNDRRILATAHDAFSYFGRAYNFKVIGLQGMSTDAEIGTSDIQSLVSYLVDYKVPVIFVESSIAPRSIQAVEAACAYRGWSIKIGDELFSDALSDAQGPAATYVQMMEHNIRSIVKGLSR